MIRVSRLNKEHFFVNSDLIEFVEETPNTIISMASGRKIVVSESADEVKRLIIEFKRLTNGVEDLPCEKEAPREAPAAQESAPAITVF
ncbi:MAG: flagellar FlbD family protein [Clostridiaceae bacterium]|nr:flagellar FlbD family protein [Eubacteriales bacterium]